MGLHDAIKELDEELETGIEKTEEDNDNAEEQEQGEKDAAIEGVQETKEDQTDEADEEEETPEEVKDEDPKVPTKAEEDDRFARLRRDAAAEKRRADTLAEKLLQQQQPKAPEVEKPASIDAEPDPELDPDAHVRWELAQTKAELKKVSDYQAQEVQKQQTEDLRNDAVKSFSSYENSFSPSVKDYNEVTSYGVNQLAASISRLRPDLKGAELGKVVQNQVLRMAGEALDAGYDPAEHFYKQSKEWGYQPKQKQEDAETDADPAPTKDVKLKPSLKNIAKHKKKSTSSLTSGSGTPPPLGAESFSGMKFSEVAKLSPADLKAWENLQ